MRNISNYIFEATKSELSLDIDTKKVIDLLQDALAEEFNAWYQYLIVCPYLQGLERTEIVEEYKKNAEDELEDHAYWLMERISQLNGTPDKVISPDMWNKTASHKYITPDKSFDVKKSLRQNIEAEIGAIETYTKIEKLVRDKDIVTHTKIKEILADEQEHLQCLQDLLKDIS